MEWWQIFGVIFLVLGTMYVISSFAEAAENKKQETLLALAPARNHMLQKWDEKEIAMELNHLQTKPRLLVHYVESVKQRFIEKQDVKTAAVRIAFIEKQVSMLRLANEYLDLQNELSLKRKRFVNEGLRIDKENQTIRLGFDDEKAEREIKTLENERRRIETQLELAKLKRDLEAINNPPQPTREPTKAERDAQKLKEIDQKISNVIARIAEIETSSVLSEDDKQRQLNQLRNKLFDLEEERNDLL
jgi:Skp family chaperone for outer membrane proteins